MKQRYYYSNEQDKILSMDEIKNEFLVFQSNGEYKDMTFDEYLKNGMYYNNGDLTPIIDKYDSIRKKLAKIELLAEQHGKLDRYGIFRVEPSHEYDDEIEELKTQIEEYEKYI